MNKELFDEDLILEGLEQRKGTLGAEYVEKNLAAADDFTRPFQEAMTAWCWGFGCGVSMALECYRVAREVLEEAGEL